MGVFDNLKIMKDSITKNLANVNSSFSTINSEKERIRRLNIEVTAINGEIDTAYRQIGEKFVEYVRKTQEMPDIGVENIFAILGPKIERKESLKVEIIELEKKIKDQIILQEKERVMMEFNAEKEKLDKALGMDIITSYEYEEKLKAYRNRVTYFDDIRRIEKQYEMRIISFAERETKINEILMQ